MAQNTRTDSGSPDRELTTSRVIDAPRERVASLIQFHPTRRASHVSQISSSLPHFQIKLGTNLVQPEFGISLKELNMLHLTENRTLRTVPLHSHCARGPIV